MVIPMNLCPKCGFPRIMNGKRKLKDRGLVQNYICKRCGCQARDSDFKGFTYPKRNYEISNPIKFLIKISERFVIRLSCGY